MRNLTVRNLTNSPQDLEGGIRLPAMGSVTDSFSDHYASLLIASPGVEVSEVEGLQKVSRPEPQRRSERNKAHAKTAE